MGGSHWEEPRTQCWSSAARRGLPFSPSARGVPPGGMGACRSHGPTRAAWGLSAGPRERASYRAEREVCVGDSKTEVTFRVTVKKEG